MLRIVAWISLIMLVTGIVLVLLGQGGPITVICGCGGLIGLVLVVYKTPWLDLDYQDDYDGGG